MPQMTTKALVSLIGAMMLAAMASPAHAYMGAGAGLSAIGSVLSFIGVVLLMLFGFIWYPLKRRFKKMRGGDREAASTSEQVEASEADSSDK